MEGGIERERAIDLAWGAPWVGSGSLGFGLLGVAGLVGAPSSSAALDLPWAVRLPWVIGSPVKCMQRGVPSFAPSLPWLFLGLSCLLLLAPLVGPCSHLGPSFALGLGLRRVGERESGMRVGYDSAIGIGGKGVLREPFHEGRLG